MAGHCGGRCHRSGVGPYPHFYYNYYVYQYATGYAAAIALSRRILKEGGRLVEDYLKFLRGGSSLPHRAA